MKKKIAMQFHKKIIAQNKGYLLSRISNQIHSINFLRYSIDRFNNYYVNADKSTN